MTTILVANRGEVALRVFRTARRMGMRCVAVYSDADTAMPFVREADDAFRIGPPPAAESYLRIDRLIDAAKEAGAELVHPGYGFLAEDSEFAEACESSGLTFVGPPATVLRLMGAKDRARQVAVAAGVPVTPGYAGEDQSDSAFEHAAGDVGYPLIVKPAEGGGGKGMAIVNAPAELANALAGARRIGRSAFGSERLLIERYISGAHHVEVQILADSHGHIVHLGERDCSLQRRHQKIMEESPSPSIDDDTRKLLTESAVALARHSDYRNAGTCEFVVDDHGQISFLEMNARLQVEHPVTEMVTGLDLVELQLRIALGEELPFSQKDIAGSGHAIEVRVYAEENFVPQAGKIVHVKWPEEARVDTGVEHETDVSAFYDPMIAKLIVHAPSRREALEAMGRVLGQSEVLGVKTNLGQLSGLLQEEVVRKGRITTTWLESVPASPPDALVPEQAIALAAAAEASRLVDSGSRQKDPFAALGPWRMSGGHGHELLLRVGDKELTVPVYGKDPFTIAGHTVERGDGCHSWVVDGNPAAAARDGAKWFIWWLGRQHEIDVGPSERRAEEASAAHLEAPMPGLVIAVRVAAGDKVTRGQELVVVEAMKMEHAVRAPADGVVGAVLCAPGDQVDRGQTLVDFEPS